MPEKKNIFIIIAVVLVILVAGLLLWQNTHPRKKLTSNQTSLTTMVKLDNSKLPTGFPPSLPVEAGAEITQNYTATVPSMPGVLLSTREFVSKKSVDDNAKFYKIILQRLGWSVVSVKPIADGGQQLISASRPGQSLSIRIYTANGQVRVEITNQVKN